MELDTFYIFSVLLPCVFVCVLHGSWGIYYLHRFDLVLLWHKKSREACWIEQDPLVCDYAIYRIIPHCMRRSFSCWNLGLWALAILICHSWATAKWALSRFPVARPNVQICQLGRRHCELEQNGPCGRHRSMCLRYFWPVSQICECNDGAPLLFRKTALVTARKWRRKRRAWMGSSDVTPLLRIAGYS